jgi:hypothetical protein
MEHLTFLTRALHPQFYLLLLHLLAAAQPVSAEWRGPLARVSSATGAPVWSLRFNASGSTSATSEPTTEELPAVWFTTGAPGLLAKSNATVARFERELRAAARVGLRITSVVLAFGTSTGGPPDIPGGVPSAETLRFMRRVVTLAPSALFLLRLRLDFDFLDPTTHGPGKVVLQGVKNASRTLSDWTNSPTAAWARAAGALAAAAMAALDAVFPGRIIGAQLTHGVSLEWNLPSIFNSPKYANMWPDYSAGTMAEFRGGCTGRACAPPSARQRDTPTVGNTLVTADTAAGAAAVRYSHFINHQMAAAISTVCAAIKRASGGNAWCFAFYGADFNSAVFLQESGQGDESGLLQVTAVDGIANPTKYSAASRADWGGMIPQGPWDSPRVHAMTYVIEYDMRSWLAPNRTLYRYVDSLAATADLLKHDMVTAAIHGHALYMDDGWVQMIVSDSERDTQAVWDAVGDAVAAASLLRRTPALGLVAEVAVFVDDLAAAHWPVGLGLRSYTPTDKAWAILCLERPVRALASLPAPVRVYTITDLLHPGFPVAGIKLAVLVNPLAINATVWAAAEAKLMAGNRTVLFSAAAGIIDGAGRYRADGGRAMTGLAGLTSGDASSVQPATRRTAFAAAPESDAWPAGAAKTWGALVGTASGTHFAASPWYYYDERAGSAAKM